MAANRYCDGILRRDFLKVGVLGGLGGLELSLGAYLRRLDAGTVQGRQADSAILIYLQGGPSHLDTFDMKPDAPEEFRGEFNPIQTNVAGIEISEHLPKLARCADKFAVLRGVSHNLAAHQLGTEYMTTGNRPLPSLEFPGYGSVVSKELQTRPDLPPFVAIPNTRESPGYLGVAYGAFSTNSTPQPGRPFNVRGISLGRGLTLADLERRQSLLKDLDTAFKGFESDSELLRGLDRFSQKAYDIITSRRTREAFDVSREPPSTAQEFGGHAFGQSCLLACRLIEAGVRFVTVSFGGWDTHQGNFERLKTNQLPPLDEGLAALFTTLYDKGLLGSTSVFVTGEFGRTPKVNERGGRDHWPRAMFVLFGGGGIQGGQVIGASDEKGMGPAERSISPDDVAASFYHSLGIDHTKENYTTTGRPVMIVRHGTVLGELFA